MHQIGGSFLQKLHQIGGCFSEKVHQIGGSFPQKVHQIGGWLQTEIGQKEGEGVSSIHLARKDRTVGGIKLFHDADESLA